MSRIKDKFIDPGVNATKIADGSVSNAEYQRLDGVTSDIQTQIDGKADLKANDIVETSFAAADNQAVAANITGFAFTNANVRSFEAHLSIFIDGTANTYEKFNIEGIQKGSSWEITLSSVGDNTGIVLDITSLGQITYTSPATTGFVSNTMKFSTSNTSGV